MTHKIRIALWLSLALIITLLDQLTKYWANHTLHYSMPVDILPIVSLNLHYNTGVAFSFLSSDSGWQRWPLALIAIIITTILVSWLWRLKHPQWLLGLSLTLIIGGALGNLWDRLQLGYVIDFISVHYQTWYFPIFNVADCAISTGIALLLLDMLLHGHHH